MFRILHEDADLLAINKPAGLVCHPSKDGEYGGELRYSSNSTGSWRLLNIDAADSDFVASATDTAVAVDDQGKVHIAYYREGGLRYATNR